MSIVELTRMLINNKTLVNPSKYMKDSFKHKVHKDVDMKVYKIKKILLENTINILDIKEIIKEPIKEIIKEPFKEPVKEISKEPIKEIIKEPFKEIIKEPFKEIIKEPVKHFQCECGSVILKTNFTRHIGSKSHLKKLHI